MENENKLDKIKKENKRFIPKKLQSQLDLLLHGQVLNREELRVGFRQLAYQNPYLSYQNQQLLDLNQELKQQLETVVEELNQIKQERQEKAARKEVWANRKGLAKRDPVTPEIYQALINATKTGIIRYNGYTAVRLRIALCLLTITGIRVNELLPLKVHQLKTLLSEDWIVIDRSKREPASHKAYLSKQGKQILKSRQKDFDLLYLFKED